MQRLPSQSMFRRTPSTRAYIIGMSALALVAGAIIWGMNMAALLHLSASLGEAIVLSQARQYMLANAMCSVVCVAVACSSVVVAAMADRRVDGLRASEARFRMFSDIMIEGIVLHDQGWIIDANAMSAALFGVPQHAMIGQHLLLFVVPEMHQRVTEHMQRDYAQPYEVMAVRRDGTLFPIEISGRKVWYHGRWVRGESVRDISSRKLIESALSSSEERFRQLAEHIDDMFWVYVPALRQVIYVSAAYETIWGRSCVDLYDNPQTILATIHPDDRVRVEGILREATPHNEEYRIVRPDGTTRWIWSRAFTVQNKHGVAYRMAGVAEDITERKHVEVALQESEATIRELYTIVSAQHLRFDERIDALLAMGARCFGLPLAMLNQIEQDTLHVLAALSPDDVIVRGTSCPASQTFCSVVAASTEPLSIAHTSTTSWRSHPCYSSMHFEAYFGTAVLVRGQAYGSLCFASTTPRETDFTDHDRDVLRLMAQWISGEIERNMAEDERAEQYRAANRAQSENRAVLDAASDGMVLIASHGVVLSANRRFVELFGVPEHKIVGQTSAPIVQNIPRYFAEPETFMQRFADIEHDHERQARVIVWQVAPERRELAVMSRPVHSQDSYIGRLYVFRDITHERAVERMKSDLVAMVSHELRTPLTSIKGYVDILLEGEAGTLAPTQSEFLDIVKSNADRLMMLISDLMDVAKIESGHIKLDREALDLGQVIRGVVNLLNIQFASKQQQCMLDVPSSLPLVCGDAGRVAQIMTNLLSNAHKYTPAGGSIQVGVWQDHQWLHVQVRDDGIGISEHDQAQLFTPFFRVRNRATKEVSGTGLGLSITRSLVEMHGGAISLESMPGQGTTFRFTLPLMPDHPVGEHHA